MAENIVRKRFKSNTTNEFTVLKKSNEKYGREFLYEIEFDEVNGVNYQRLALRTNIIKGEVKNPFYISVHGIGYLGNATKKGSDLIYNRWKSVLKRCYEPNHKSYRWYGAKGVKVSENWLCFENFLHDFKLLEGYDEDNLKNLELDKDIKIPGNKIYSFETCMLVSKEENFNDMIKRNYHY